MTKEEILRICYEERYSSQKYDKSVLKGTFSSVIEKAMDIYARQISQDFAWWMEEYTFGRSKDEISQSFEDYSKDEESIIYKSSKQNK